MRQMMVAACNKYQLLKYLELPEKLASFSLRNLSTHFIQEKPFAALSVNYVAIAIIERRFHAANADSQEYVKFCCGTTVTNIVHNLSASCHFKEPNLTLQMRSS